MTLPVWVWVIWVLLVLSGILGTIAYRRLIRSLEDAVVLIFESGWISSVDGARGTVQYDDKKMNAEAEVRARRIIACATLLHRQWLRRKLGEYIVRWCIDGFATRPVQ